ncbi:hypothetical protein VOLCADRAFT_96703 [Volvox carteri f. nagariensis]|uniref:Uncharacterized protein n=1 Tax=Volvox carteri f. nagariensis TaxID=3068 RepID=D8UAU3_VOLCA|nr:uncharacterized protein VOLCADRAFT_96703 [Volvox carteri f. nagariensis]EFJ43218.1 hypothetical protein VOLCADRAFT_96703 [Volvox carteri f. nagariensis]|eukprot:XP_002955793.1 hypothetical protein VOLCADRAFT_96703 [Volvox carteri f. nagariensis]
MFISLPNSSEGTAVNAPGFGVRSCFGRVCGCVCSMVVGCVPRTCKPPNKSRGLKGCQIVYKHQGPAAAIHSCALRNYARALHHQQAAAGRRNAMNHAHRLRRSAVSDASERIDRRTIAEH